MFNLDQTDFQAICQNEDFQENFDLDLAEEKFVKENMFNQDASDVDENDISMFSGIYNAKEITIR